MNLCKNRGRRPHARLVGRCQCLRVRRYSFSRANVLSRTYLDSLGEIYRRLSQTDLNWCIVGSIAPALQGVRVQVHGIDIKTDRAGAYEIGRVFAEFAVQQVEFSSTDKIRSHLGALMIHGIRVEIIGDAEIRRADGTWQGSAGWEKHRQVVMVEGMAIPVLSLEYEYESYLALGRLDKAEVIAKYLPSDWKKPENAM